MSMHALPLPTHLRVCHQPSHVAPPEALIRGVGVQGRVCVQVVLTVVAHPTGQEHTNTRMAV